MAKYVNTKDDSLGARILSDDKIAVARIIDDRKVVEIIEGAEQIKQIIDTAIPILDHIIKALIDFFSSIFNPFPCVIVLDGQNYVFTEQKAPFKAIDRVFYMNQDEKNDIKFMFEAQHMPKAKRELRKELKSLGYIK